MPSAGLETVASIDLDEIPPARIPGGYVPPSIADERSRWALQPSRETSGGQGVGPSMSVSVGATPVASRSPAAPAPDRPGPTEPVATAPVATAPVATADHPVLAAAAPPAPDYVPTPALPPVSPPASFAAPPVPAPASEKPARKESTPELVSFGLVAAGAIIGVASLFLPWANGGGIGIGNYATANVAPPDNQWGWGMPASVPLLLLSGLVLAAITGKVRILERLPSLAGNVGRVIDQILPMILGGLYMGVFLLYLTLPSGYGSGVVVLFIGACLLIAGATVSLFTSPEVSHRGP